MMKSKDKSQRTKQTMYARRRMKAYLVSKGFRSFTGFKNNDLANACAEKLGIERINGSDRAHFLHIAGALHDLGVAAANPQKKQADVNAKIAAFYISYAWRQLRYRILEKYGAACMVCGKDRRDGTIIHVDHIKPLRFNWDLRLDPENLQVLCEECNHGKGNWDSTDWREPSLSKLMGESCG